MKKTIGARGAAILLGLVCLGTTAAEVMKLDFAVPPAGFEAGGNRPVDGKPGFGPAGGFAGTELLRLTPPPGLVAAERAGRVAFECWLKREADDLHGYLIRHNGAFSLLVIPWDPSRLNLGVWTGGGYVSLDTEPCLRSGVWQHVAFVVEPAAATIYVDGKVRLTAPLASPMLASEEPVAIAGGIDEGDGGSFGLLEAALGEIILHDESPGEAYFAAIQVATTENFEATQNTIGLPPAVSPGRNITERVPPVIVLADGELKVENAFYSAVFATAGPLRLVRLFNKYADAECLLPGGTPLFSVGLDGRALPADGFAVREIRREDIGGAAVFTLICADAKAELAAAVELTFGDSRDIGMNCTLVNEGAERRLQLTWPLLDNLSIGDDFSENYYFWPMLTGWVGDRSYELGMAYGNRCWIQMSDVFSPKLGGGVALSGRDTGGTVKGIVVRKTRPNGQVGVNYNINFLPSAPAASPFTADSRGLAMAHVYLPQLMARGAAFTAPPALVTVHPGSMLEPLRDYRAWLDTWYEHEAPPESILDSFNMVAVHRKVGNRGFETGFGREPGRLMLADKIHPDGRDHQLQLAMWWQEHTPGKVASGEGDYEYDPTLGGLEGMKTAVSEADALGTGVSLYLCSRQAGDDSEVAQYDELAFYPTPEARANDWGSFNPCTHAHRWQDLLAGKYARLARELPLAGLYLDTSAEFLLCHNPGHPHAANLIDDQVRLLTRVRDAVKEARPEAFFFTEFMGSEFFGQLIDACWIQTFANPHAHAFNNYDLDFVRFVLPQIKYFEWGMNDQTFEVDSRRIFFNGVGGGRGDLTDEQNQRFADLTNTMREAGGAFDSLRPEPLVATLQPRLYANCFPGSELTAWTFYNKTGGDFRGAAIAAPADAAAYRWIELLHDRPAAISDGTVQLELECDEVGLLARFVPRMDIAEDAGGFTVTLRDAADCGLVLTCLDAERDSADAETALDISSGTAYINRRDLSGGRLIVKLRDGHRLADEIILGL